MNMLTPNLNQEKETKPRRKAPGLDDPYEHAPPKPDGDLWAILLKPEMEADKRYAAIPNNTGRKLRAAR
jgi:hypothetical protein